MTRHYERYIYALGGLVLAASTPAFGQDMREGRGDQAPAQHASPPRLSAVTRRALPQPPAANRPADEAVPGLNRRSVEAAERQAEQATKANQLAAKSFPFTVLQGLSAFAGLVITAVAAAAAIYAAWYAKRAAEHAEDGVKVSHSALEHARKTAALDARAWVEIDLELVDFRRRPDFFSVTVEVKLRNLGKTPAWNVGASVAPFFHASTIVNGGPAPKLDKFPSALSPMMPGREQRQRFGVRFECKDLAAIEEECRSGGIPMLCIDAAVYYSVVGEMAGDAPRVNSIRYIILPTPTDDQGPVPRDWLRPGPETVAEVRMSEVKGAKSVMT